MAVMPTIEKGGANLIYAIRLTSDPTYEYRYVGLTTQGTGRFRQHIADARWVSGVNYFTSKSMWIREHFYAVTFDVLHTVEAGSELDFYERMWIHLLKERGHRLFNLTSGGAGGAVSEETRLKMSEAKRGEKHWAYGTGGETHYNYGRSHSEETKLQLSKAITGIKRSAETRAKMSASTSGANNPRFGKPAHNKGVPMSEEQKDTLSAISKGKTNVGHHTRWHTNRGIEDPKCRFCTQS